MQQFNYNFQLSESSEQIADSKMQSLSTLAKKLTHSELAKMAQILLYDPVKTALAKKALGV